MIWANYFGRRSLGTVRSLSMPLAVGFGALGPLFAGFAYDVWGNYQGALFIVVVLFLGSAGLLSVARPPTLKKSLTATQG